MQGSRIVWLGLILMVGFACKRKETHRTEYDNVLHDLDTTKIYASNAEKNKQKTATQYISILYSDLYDRSIGGTELAELAELTLAMGDKVLSNELVLTHYLNSSGVNIPSDALMRADPDQFVEDIYLRFYQRIPSPYEKIYLVKLIESDPAITAKDMYTSFALSNEYYFY